MAGRDVRLSPRPPLTPDLLLRAYAAGLFPLAEGRNSGVVHWVDPSLRGVFPLAGFHISRSLSARIATCGWRVGVDTDFEAVVRACADREETWINAEILRLYVSLHASCQAHSLELREGDALVGGVYGVVLGGAFFGESMFSRRTDASKVALAWLMHRLRAGGFTLFDTQFLTPHLASLGAEEISQAEYRRQLGEALVRDATFDPPGYAPTAQDVRQRRIQTS